MYSHLLDDGLVDDLYGKLGRIWIDEPFVDRSLCVESWDVTSGVGVSLIFFSSLRYVCMCASILLSFSSPIEPGHSGNTQIRE